MHSPTSRRAIVAGAALLATSVVLPAFAVTTPRIRHHGVLVRVKNLDRALGFYGDGLGFAIGALDMAKGMARLATNLPVYLEQSAAGALPVGRVAHAEITLQTANLDAAMTAARRAGGAITTDTPFEVAVGKSFRFTDPDGIEHHWLQPNRPGLPRAEPNVYNSGFVLPKAAIAPARGMLEQGAGFKAMTERYFPPSVPYLESDGGFAFMLHHHQPDEPDYAPRETGSASDLGSWQIFSTDRLTETVRLMLGFGAQAIDNKPRPFANGRRMAMLTPGGGPFELWEWS